MSDSTFVDALVQSGLTVHLINAVDARLEVDGDLISAQFKRLGNGHPPTPHQLRRILESTENTIVLFSVHHISPRARAAAAENPRVGFVSDTAETLLPAQLKHLTRPASTQPTVRARGRVPWAKFALMRSLLRTSEPRKQSELSKEISVSQGAVSQAATKLATFIVQEPGGWFTENPLELWNEFMAEYPGAGGMRTYWFARGPLLEQVTRLPDTVLLSADAAADTIAPWRSPQRIVVYTDAPLDMVELDFSPSVSDQSTLTLVSPADYTLTSSSNAWGRKRIVDPVIAAWDLINTGGNDAREAAERIHDRVMESFA